MSLWTKLAAVFSILASVVTIYNFGFKPKDSPSLWAMVSGQSDGLQNQSCGIMKRGAASEPPGVLRAGPGSDHPQVANLQLGSKVVVLQKVDNWVLVRLDEGLSSSVQGWATTVSVENAPCRGPTQAATPVKAPTPAPAPSATPPKK